MGKDIALKGTPNPRQEEFFLATARHIAYGGARGGGKSWAIPGKTLRPLRMCSACSWHLPCGRI